MSDPGLFNLSSTDQSCDGDSVLVRRATDVMCRCDYPFAEIGDGRVFTKAVCTNPAHRKTEVWPEHPRPVTSPSITDAPPAPIQASAMRARALMCGPRPAATGDVAIVIEFRKALQRRTNKQQQRSTNLASPPTGA